MNPTFKAIINFPLGLLGLKLQRNYGYHWRHAKKIINEAKGKNMTVGEYVDTDWGQSGLGRNVFNQLKAYGILNYKEPRILEVGAGTGRHLEKMITITVPQKYEVYELDDHWAEYLEREFKIKRQLTKGTSLDSTPDHSIDILTAHGLFNGPIEFIGCMKYLSEFIRVIKDDGLVVFDIFSEECLETANINNWVNKIPEYIKFLPAGFIKDLCKKNGLILQGSFRSPLIEGFDAQYLVFKKQKV